MSSKNEAFYLKIIVSAKINPVHRASRFSDSTQLLVACGICPQSAEASLTPVQVLWRG